MSHSILREGGPHGIRRVGTDQYEMSVALPCDEDGLIGRECPQKGCSPAYFKVKTGTGITEDYDKSFCPYCRSTSDPEEFCTEAQKGYALSLLERESIKGLNRELGRALGVEHSGRKQLGNGMFSIELSYTPARLPLVRHPAEEELRRDVKCPHCTLEHAVFGLAVWCPDCGTDIFLIHVAEEFNSVKRMLSEVDKRKKLLGPRIAARDIENALEDTVSIFEAVLKVMSSRHLTQRGLSSQEVERLLDREVRNAYQSLERAIEIFLKLTGVHLFTAISQNDRLFLKNTFEKRHPITHNLGVIDRKYMARVVSGELAGREIRVTVEECQRRSKNIPPGRRKSVPRGLGWV